MKLLFNKQKQDKHATEEEGEHLYPPCSSEVCLQALDADRRCCVWNGCPSSAGVTRKVRVKVTGRK